MPKSDRVYITPPTNTPISQNHPVDAPSRRRFLTNAAAVAAGGAVMALATIQPAPASPLDPANASPALRAAAIALDDAHSRLKEARAAFDAADRLPEEWRRLNPKPTGSRAIKRWNRRERENRHSLTMGLWRAVIGAEDDFREAQMAVAMVAARDMDELALKACMSGVYDTVHLYCGRASPIGFSVAFDLISLTTAVAS
ncbi:twin-arginine translocation signal domain-containing protein [Bradyrhizobium sp. AZCC 2289]|uniref:twin-arginine translocation signal domain-containing protein n=1 Tax=Bradyrhizobium sp. AZCC 2289 TaxID=3117026 RepID=UPI002FEFD14F